MIPLFTHSDGTGNKNNQEVIHTHPPPHNVTPNARASIFFETDTHVSDNNKQALGAG